MIKAINGMVEVSWKSIWEAMLPNNPDEKRAIEIAAAGEYGNFEKGCVLEYERRVQETAKELFSSLKMAKEILENIRGIKRLMSSLVEPVGMLAPVDKVDGMDAVDKGDPVNLLLPPPSRRCGHHFFPGER